MTWRTGAAAVAALSVIPLGLGAQAAQAADPVGTVSFGNPAGTYAVAVQPGRISYSVAERSQESPKEFDVITRTMSAAGGKLTYGAEQTIFRDTSYAALSGSAGWLQYAGPHLRDSAGVITKNGGSAPPQASGNRVLLRWRVWDGSGGLNWSYPMIADLRTKQSAERPEDPASLFGNYLAYAKADGSVRVKDLARNVEGVHRPAGSKIKAVAIHGKWLAWVTACTSADPCSQTLTIRDTAAKTQRTIGTRGTTSLKLSGGYLALDVRPTDAQRDVRTIKLGTTIAPVVVGTLPANEIIADPWDVADATPDQFDLDDETLAWTDKTFIGKAVRLAPFIDPPVYLGNVIAPASMSTTWSLRLPVSKALPTCQVTFYYGSTKVRIMNCANVDGMVKATWDGKSGSGGKLAKGTYTYRVTGQDADKYNLRNYNGTFTAVGGSITKTA
ncbi:hypothetical protein OG394_26825 [Kribbella sp. NBC_01245]|uniref:hypothetical protein n=1 Tax=Kribbella sp. NBC_01245 TaxID=2903578 RepID=UPI002E2A9EAA|nr:hypothetical protein [Kribbella sp. NBC_01245]